MSTLESLRSLVDGATPAAMAAIERRRASIEVLRRKLRSGVYAGSDRERVRWILAHYPEPVGAPPLPPPPPEPPGGAPPAPKRKVHRLRTLDDTRKRARELQVPGRSKLRKDALKTEVRKAVRREWYARNRERINLERRAKYAERKAWDDSGDFDE